MHLDFLSQPAYGQKAAEVWKEVTGNYPMLPHNLKDGEGAVLMNAGETFHVVGFFGFQDFQDRVLVFKSYLEAERLYQGIKKNPSVYLRQKLLKFEGMVETEAAPEEVLANRPKPKHMYEGSGANDE